MSATPQRSALLPSLRLGRRGAQAVALLYLGALLIVPLIILVRSALQAGVGAWWQAVTLPIAWHALQLTLWTAAVVAVIDVVMGTLIAYLLVRDDVPGKAALNAIIDLPLAVPTLVTGILFVLCFGPQTALGQWFAQHGKIDIVLAPPGIVLVLLFITLPLVVRSVQPVLAGLDRAPEAAAATLGASSWTIFWRVILPEIVLPITSGGLLSFARCIGEFGAIVLVAGNIAFHSLTASVYVYGEIESDDQLGASAVSLVLLLLSFALVLTVDWLRGRRQGAAT